jgi:GR25 family glycosyltransferase involved in LPS biosynthesis
MNQNKITPLGYLLIATFFILLSYAGWIYTKSIDWTVLKRMENSPLTLPTGVPSPTATISATPKK